MFIYRQLDPVAGESLLDVSETSLAGALPLWSQFEYVELTENMRQGEDKEFAHILRKIGDYEQLTDDERKLIESRFVRLNNLEVPDSATRLYHRNKDVDLYNNTRLLKNPAESILVIEARDRVEESRTYVHTVSASARRRSEARTDAVLERARGLTTPLACGLPFKFIAVVGFPYMVTRNIDTPDGLVNGAVGELVWVEFGTLRQPQLAADSEQERVAVRRLWLRFPNRTGRVRSAAHRQELREAVATAGRYAPSVWPYEQPPPPTEEQMEGLVPIEMEDITLTNVVCEPWRNVKRQQFPLVSALAMTIHKVQGTTKDYILVVYKSSLSNDMVYVAVSRVTKLSGLFVDDSMVTADKQGHLFQHPPKLEVEEGESLPAKERARRERLKEKKQRFLAEKERLRGRRLVPRWQALLDAPRTQPRMMYHNVQGLAKHLEDIKADEVYMTADLLLLAETHLKPQDQLALGEAWQLAARCDWAGGERRGGGAAIYSRLPCVEVPCPPHTDIEAAMVQVGATLRMAVLYCHGKPKAADVVEYVSSFVSPAPPGVLTVLCGDFNIDMSHPAAGPGKQLMESLAALGLNMRNSNKDVTTYCDLGGATVLDAVFSNAPELRVDRYQSYFSYHLPLVVSMPK